MSWGGRGASSNNNRGGFVYQPKPRTSTTNTGDTKNNNNQKQKVKRDYSFPAVPSTTNLEAAVSETTPAAVNTLPTTESLKEYHLYTCGYGSFQKTEDFCDSLFSFGISDVIDIRINPYSSHNKDYNANNLQSFLKDKGIAYHHYIELGNQFKGADPALFGEHPFIEVLQAAGEILTRRLRKTLLATTSEKVKIAIMCACSDVNSCHRKAVSEYMQQKWGLTITHINFNKV